LEPIWLCEGRILDGRNRYRACRALGIAPLFRAYTGDSPIAFAWSVNGERRHLSSSQRAAIGAEMLPALQQEALERRDACLKRGTALPVLPPVAERDDGPRRKHRTIEAAARIVGAGATNIQYAKTVRERAPHLFEQIKTGALTVKRAYRQTLNHPEPDPSAFARQPKAIRIEAIRSMAREGYRMAQIAARLKIGQERVSLLAKEGGIVLPDASLGHVYTIKAHRVVEETVSTLEGLALGLSTVSGARFECSRLEANEWLQSMEHSLRMIAALRKYLRECLK
jgi:hypothetical protein